MSSPSGRFPRGPSEIFDWLFIGRQEDSTNLELLTRLRVTHVINCISRSVDAILQFATVSTVVTRTPSVRPSV